VSGAHTLRTRLGPQHFAANGGGTPSIFYWTFPRSYLAERAVGARRTSHRASCHSRGLDVHTGHYVQRYHRAMMERAAEAIHVSHEQRQIESITLCLSEARMRDLKARVESFCDEVLQEYQGTVDSCRVVQVNVQMFPLTVEG
jgi:hypothetical protein